jgi:putative isomerase
MDWHTWQWTRRRVVVPGSVCCDEPGYISVGNDYASDCANPCDCVGNFKGESGLDQSPKWDGINALPDGSGGDCTGMAVNGSRILQFGETQSSSLFVADAEALAALAGAINRTSEQALLLSRAAAMRGQVARLFDEEQNAYMDLYVQSGHFSTRLSPTSFYPLLALGEAAPPAQVSAMVGHLLNASEFCVSATFETTNPDTCFWGLPSISASDRSYMLPLNYVYWRGLSWGPMSLLTYWSLNAVRSASSPAVDAAASALAAQKNAQFSECPDAFSAPTR